MDVDVDPKAQSPSVELTAEACREIADTMRWALDRFGIDPHPASDLARMIEDVSWLGQFEPLPIRGDAALAVDPERALLTLARILQAKELARTLAISTIVPGAATRVAQLASKLDWMTTVESPAQNTYTELDVAARLARHAQVRFLDPPALDITCSFESHGDLAVECKRVRSWKQIGKRLRDAVDQAGKQHLPTLVVLDVQPLLYRTNDPERRVYFDLLDDVSQLRAQHEANLVRIVSDADADIQRALNRGIQAVCVCAMTWGWVLSTPEYRYSWVSCWVATDPEVRAVLPLLDQLLN